MEFFLLFSLFVLFPPIFPISPISPHFPIVYLSNDLLSDSLSNCRGKSIQRTNIFFIFVLIGEVSIHPTLSLSLSPCIADHHNYLLYLYSRRKASMKRISHEKEVEEVGIIYIYILQCHYFFLFIYSKSIDRVFVPFAALCFEDRMH